MGLEQLAIAAAQRTPEATAVVGPDGSLSYAALDRAATRLALRLAEAGVGPGDRVALWLPKSCRAIVAMQATLRLGAIYVPIDPEGPARRARKVIVDAGARCLISDGRPSPLEPGDPELLCLEVDLDLAGAVEPWQGRVDDEEALAYILYTSGS
ncbi:MAG: AMP-binding protein, partial [Myxococcales bacterium]|nr:AMP-binding protein [Myxococcales bacterium]